MLIKVLGLVASLAAVSAVKPSHDTQTIYIPGVGASKDHRSSPDIIYIDDGHIHSAAHHLPSNRDQNDLIASLYGPVFLKPAWIYPGLGEEHRDDDDHDHRRPHEPLRLRDLPSDREHKRLLELIRHQERQRLLDEEQIHKKRLLEQQLHREHESNYGYHQPNPLDVKKGREQKRIKYIATIHHEDHNEDSHRGLSEHKKETERQRERLRNQPPPSQREYEYVDNRNYPGYDYSFPSKPSERPEHYEPRYESYKAPSYGQERGPQEYERLRGPSHDKHKGVEYKPAWVHQPEVGFYNRLEEQHKDREEGYNPSWGRMPESAFQNRYEDNDHRHH